MHAVDAPLLDEATVGAHLARRGLVRAGAPLAVRALGGGVSNVVLAVDDGARRLVVKQSLPRLRVAEEWRAPRVRALTEARALGLVGTWTPGAVPRVLDADEETCAIVIEHAPAGWRDWKADLLDGRVDPGVAAEVGRLLGTWARRSAGTLDPGIADPDAFEALRVEPYHRTVLARHPELREPLEAGIAAIAGPRVHLVHGDASPKNVLVGPGGLWVIDFEVAHLGASPFDPGFLQNHLLLKAIHLPALHDDLARAGARFADALADAAGPDLAPVPDAVCLQVGCLMLARVDGKSPAEYLDARGRDVARRAATRILRERPAEPAALWPLVREVAG